MSIEESAKIIADVNSVKDAPAPTVTEVEEITLQWVCNRLVNVLDDITPIYWQDSQLRAQAVKLLNGPLSPVIAVPRAEWERMQAESEAFAIVRAAWDDDQRTNWSGNLFAAIRDQINRLDSLAQPNAAEG